MPIFAGSDQKQGALCERAVSGARVVTESSPGGRRSPTDAEVVTQIDAELVRYVVRQAPIGFAIGMVAVAAVVVVLWNAASRAALCGWVVGIGLLTLPVAI